jgi:hypothetical protein
MLPKRHGEARPLRQPSSYNLARGLPLRQQTHDFFLCIEADRVAGNDHKLVG